MGDACPGAPVAHCKSGRQFALLKRNSPAVLDSGGHNRMDADAMSGVFWGIGLGVLYLVLIFTLAVMSFRKGHWVLGLIGFIFPVLWLIGAILPSRYRRA
jgi:hypothetical protein